MFSCYIRPVNFVMGVLLLVSCTSATTAAPPPTLTPSIPTNTPTPITPQRVTFQTEDGVSIAGTLYGNNGEKAVILAHQGTPGADQFTWKQFAMTLAENGFTALTFDFRGVGRSGGELDYSQLGEDVRAAARYLQSQGYHHQIVCAGASMGGTACLRAAIDGEPFLGLIILASTMIAGYTKLKVLPEELGVLTQPKLFITAEDDIALVVRDTKGMYELSPEPKKLLLLKGYEHGTDLFHTSEGDKLREAMLDFIEAVFAN